VNGEKAAEGHIDYTNKSFFPNHETADEVVDETTARTDDYNERDDLFIGQIDYVTLE
jgi:hypothetical protein